MADSHLTSALTPREPLRPCLADSNLLQQGQGALGRAEPTAGALRLKIGKIGLIALKDHDFRKIPPKSFGPVTYHRKLQTLPQISIPSHFPLTRRHSVILPPFPRPTAFFLLSLVLREPRREAIKKKTSS